MPYIINASFNMNRNSKDVHAYTISIYRDEESEIKDEYTFQNGPVHNNIRSDKARRLTLNGALTYAMDYVGVNCEIFLKIVCGKPDHILVQPLNTKNKTDEFTSFKLLARHSQNGRYMVHEVDFDL